jgi:predicted PurR-regulated permease PerM
MPRHTRDRLALWVLLAMAAASVVLVYILISPFLEPVFFAAVLAIAFQPLHLWVSRRVRRPALASLATTLALLVLVLGPLAALGMTVAVEARGFYASLSEQSAQQGGWGSWVSSVTDGPVEWVASRTGMPAPSVKSIAVARAQALSASLMSWGTSLLGNLASTIGNGLLCLVVLFFLLLEGGAIREAVFDWMPLERARTSELIQSIEDSIIANVYGIAAVGTAQGLLTGAGFFLTGLHSPVLWGAIAAFASLVPIFGPALVWGPGALVLLVQGAWGKALFLFLWGALVVGMADNFIRPWVLSGRTEMNTLVVFFALMGGMQAFGFIGLFAGPVIFSVAMAVFRMLREGYLERPAAEPPPAGVP